MTKHRFLGGDMDGVVIDIPNDRHRWRTPVPTRRHHVIDSDDPTSMEMPVLDWNVQRWRRDWLLIGDDCEYLTPPAYELARSELRVALEVLDAMTMWEALACIGDELVHAMPGIIVAPPLMWCESVDPQTFAATIRATAPVVA